MPQPRCTILQVIIIGVISNRGIYYVAAYQRIESLLLVTLVLKVLCVM